MSSEALVECRYVFLFFFFFLLCLIVIYLTFFSLLLLQLQCRFQITSMPCKLMYTDTMEKIIIAAIILHNMIIVDEQDHPELDQKYLKEKEKGSSFKVSKFQRGTAQDSEMIKKHIATVRKEYMSYTEHQRLKADLLEHLWSMKGEKALLDSDSDDDE